MKKYYLSILVVLSFIPGLGKSQNIDSLTIRNIYSEALTSNIAYEQLRYLCKNIGGRIAGSPQSLQAVEYGKKLFTEAGLENVRLQETMVRNWVRGPKENAYYMSEVFGSEFVNILALGTSVGTPKDGITARVVEVQNFDELKTLGEDNIKGKIVFFNRSGDHRYINPGSAYGSAADQRVYGAIEAAKYGAVGVIVRSLTLASDYHPHTGVMHYVDTIPRIPAAGISTKDADKISELLKADPELNFYFKMECSEYPDVKSYNVIGELTGTEFPEEIILVGGHLDSWDTGEGAHDDGAGVIQALESIRLIKSLGIKPRHTIRIVWFMDEEIAQRGARTYAKEVKEKNEKHIAAIESDAGGFSPDGFTGDASDEKFAKLKEWKEFFRPYGIYKIEKGWSGVDVSFLKDVCDAALMELITDSQRYFDFHHSPADVFETINRREMQLGSAALAGLIYLIDKYGL
ncbi:MAG: M20/M25/M40 family metallo-hydrolase [Ignavibacteriae bacterium]|nr:M20/M25/M40 family metallo-hydrolase [Ignavibacteriota bacterium]